jgi:hypothetical protein
MTAAIAMNRFRNRRLGIKHQSLSIGRAPFGRSRNHVTSPGNPPFLDQSRKWRAIRNKPANSYIVDISI